MEVEGLRPVLVDDDSPWDVSFPLTVLVRTAVSTAWMRVRAGAAQRDLHRRDMVLGGTNPARLNVETPGGPSKRTLGAGLLELGAGPVIRARVRQS